MDGGIGVPCGKGAFLLQFRGGKGLFQRRQKGGVVGFDNSEEITVSWKPGERPESAPADEMSYRPVWANDEMGRKAATAGHGGGDFLMFWEFIRNIEKGEEPYWNVYRATALSAAAILGWRAALEGKTYDIPDFRDEEQRRLYENDFVSPYPDKNGVSGVRVCSKPYAPTE